MPDDLRARCAEALHVVRPDGSVLVADAALLHIYAALGYTLPVAALRMPPLSWLTGPGYRLVANNRRLFAKFTFRG